jgi:hypothetical protein
MALWVVAEFRALSLPLLYGIVILNAAASQAE